MQLNHLAGRAATPPLDGALTTVTADAERQMELAQAAIQTYDVDAAVAHLSAAIRGFAAAGQPRRAAMACANLGDIYANGLGNLAVARAWFARAIRLVEGEPPCIEQGWVAVAAMGCDVDDPTELLTKAELALDRARRFGDVNLETKALADAGLAHVQAGRVAEGMALLEEAMALACGPAEDRWIASKSVCSFFTACCYAADFERAGSWAEALRRHGLIGYAPGSQIFLSNHCDSVQATLLCELGRWTDAEALLTKAIAEFEERMPRPSYHPAIALADLRLQQGRLAEAEQLLLGKEAHIQALLPAARLHLARGDYELARAAAHRGLKAMCGDRLRAAELLDVLLDVELALGNIEAANARCAELAARTVGFNIPTLQARTAAAQARVISASGDLSGAIAVLEAAVDGLTSAAAPWLRAKLQLHLARLRERQGDRPGARVEALAAAAVLAGLDVAIPAGDAALLERLGSTGGHRSVQQTASLAREDRSWVAAYGGTRARMPDAKGLRYLAELLARPGVEQHALDLVDRIEGSAGEGPGPNRHHLGDAGELIDAQARAAYRHRIEELRSEIDDTLALGNLDKAEALQTELDQLVAQLAQAFGLGGRSRRASSAAERARLNVTRALRAATAKLVQELPEAGAALDRQIRTGLYCAYGLTGDDDVRWIVQP